MADAMVDQKNAAVTICSINYLGKALVLKESFTANHPDFVFYILIVDRKSEKINQSHPDVNFIWVEELGIPEFYKYAMMFDVIELNTNVKPAVLLKLLQRHTKVVYLDPDIRVFRRLAPIYDALDDANIVVTPHTSVPVLDGRSPCDVDFSRFGSFNLGFVGVRCSGQATSFLQWWSDRCLRLGFYEPQSGLAVDQKWVDLAPCYFEGLKILKNPGMNVAFWNLHERMLSNKDGAWWVNGDNPLYFFHYSSFVIGDPHLIAHKQDRFPKGSRPDVHALMDEYAKEIARLDVASYGSMPYSFDYFKDGTYVTPTLRRFYAALIDRFPSSRVEDPFEPKGSLYAFALKNNLAGPKHRPMPRQTFKDMGKYSAAAGIIKFGLKLVLKFAGPAKYFGLMRYMVHISSIRNQADFIGKNLKPGKEA